MVFEPHLKKQPITWRSQARILPGQPRKNPPETVGFFVIGHDPKMTGKIPRILPHFVQCPILCFWPFERTPNQDMNKRTEIL